MAVLSVDVVWTAEFAAKRLRRGTADRTSSRPTAFCKAAVDAATYFGKLYAYPSTSDGGLLYYRKDLLDKYRPEAADDLRRDEGGLRQDQGGREQRQARLLRRSVQQVRGPHRELRRGRATAPVASSSATTASRTSATPEATKGLQHPGRLVQGRHIPKGAITWQEEEGRQAFQTRRADLPPQLGLRLQPSRQERRVVRRSSASSTPRRCRVSPVRASPASAVTTTPSPRTPRTRAPRSTSSSSCRRRRSRRSNALNATSCRRRSESLYTDPDLLKKFPFYRRCSSRSRAPSRDRRPSSTVMSPWPSRMPPTAHFKVRPLLMPLCRHCRRKLETLIK